MVNENTDNTLVANQEKIEQKLYCTVVNSNALEIGLESECLFDQSGGIIGSASNCRWLLTDVDGNIYANHCEIQFIDNAYCLVDFSGKITINHSTMPIAANSPMVISANDLFQVGPYQIKATFVQNDAVDTLSLHRQTLSSIFGDDIKETNIIPDDNHYEQSVNMNKTDPLLALQAFDDASKQKDDDILWDNSKGSVESNYQYHMDAALDVSAKRNQDMSYQSTFDEPFVDNHLAMGPVMRGLKTTLSHKDNSAEMQYIAEEIGASLREAIQGLLKIQQQVTAQHFSTISKNFQPIIDNPLRMGLSYDETVELMYDDDVSLVHLSAPAAIKESLDTLFNHQEAMHYAITEALDQILVAFSPEALMHRFQYYRTARRLSAEEQNSWAWKMYQAYYSELISNRQTGFKKLFWEIFDQVYDKKMRELQMNIGVDKHD